ncbi:5-(carboxyamino)imidazole ribonucleotide synthase [Sphaerospermopsis sp. LEGE 00249]|uniref:5-(carboxyamino)imidazole ribonucleotide synthase n=1 Tax=Sphaerospermopsis sp. LEGE 00249 TaxID=1380707 RepID=UPI00164EC3E9|nr:5-(carboxyamino)imidazole ribonucleotide synthase [Sphaerospermopsis sp. LEGE 00249]MBC5795576.1 5-(carboxyamino)imidazole ribonucleotide synthase [Sphaerospermopsis sp. LEGE 00249]
MSIKRIGIIGGGQLAWMMGDGSKKLGLELIVQTPSKSDPAVSIAKDTIFAAVDDAAATEILATKCDVITFENEFVNLDALSLLEKKGVCFRPRLAALSPLLDKYHQRCYFQDLKLPVPHFFAIEKSEISENIASNIASKIEYLGFPVVLKARRHGYDGQGTFIIHDLATLSKVVNASNTQFLVEAFVPFTKELAIIAARSVTGEIVTYPVVETQQEQQVCRRVIAPADITFEQAAKVNAIAHTILNSLDVVGVFGIELFITADGKILINEIAPRTHNSGHFSIDACTTSQFEQHLRAVAGLSLTDTSLHCAGAVMINLLGYEKSYSDYVQQRQELANIPHAYLHWYSKTESRPGRKLGHITVLLEQQNRDAIESIIQKIESIWYPG